MRGRKTFKSLQIRKKVSWLALHNQVIIKTSTFAFGYPKISNR